MLKHRGCVFVACLAGLLLAVPCVAGATPYQYVDLGAGLAGSSGGESFATAGYGGLQVGYSWPGWPGKTQAAVWSGSQASGVSVSPWGHHSEIWGIHGSQMVGVGYTSDRSMGTAFLWNGVTSTVTNLQGLNFGQSAAWGVYGNRQVGYGMGSATGWANHAVAWTGTASSFVDLHPGAAYSDSEARGIWGNQIAGHASYIVSQQDGLQYVAAHAYLWPAATGPGVDLHPAGYTSTQALGVGDGQQVGFGHVTGGAAHALLWTGSAESVIDLNGSAAGSLASAAAGGKQVGYAVLQGRQHAAAWSGTAGSLVDLHAFIPSYAYSSRALGIDAAGNVYGFVNDGTRTHAAMWVPVPEPMTLALLLGPVAWVVRRSVKI